MRRTQINVALIIFTSFAFYNNVCMRMAWLTHQWNDQYMIDVKIITINERVRNVNTSNVNISPSLAEAFDGQDRILWLLFYKRVPKT